MSSSRKPPKEKTHLCRCKKCNGKPVCQSTWYAHGGSVRRSLASIPERTRDFIQSLPQTSPIPRIRKPRKRRTGAAVSTDGGSLRVSKRVVRSDSGVRFNGENAQNGGTTSGIHQIPPPQTLLESERALARSPSPATDNFKEQTSSLPHQQGGFKAIHGIQKFGEDLPRET